MVWPLLFFVILLCLGLFAISAENEFSSIPFFSHGWHFDSCSFTSGRNLAVFCVGGSVAEERAMPVYLPRRSSCIVIASPPPPVSPPCSVRANTRLRLYVTRVPARSHKPTPVFSSVTAEL